MKLRTLIAAFAAVLASTAALAGAKRLVGKPDIGCYESQAQPATVIQLR